MNEFLSITPSASFSIGASLGDRLLTRFVFHPRLVDFLLDEKGGGGAYFPSMNLYPLIAQKVEKNPAVVNEALSTLSKWEALGVMPPARLTAWRRILRDAKKGKDGMRRLLLVLRDDSESNRRLLDFGPFAGVLTREERRKVFLKCGYDH